MPVGIIKTFCHVNMTSPGGSVVPYIIIDISDVTGLGKQEMVNGVTNKIPRICFICTTAITQHIEYFSRLNSTIHSTTSVHEIGSQPRTGPQTQSFSFARQGSTEHLLSLQSCISYLAQSSCNPHMSCAKINCRVVTNKTFNQTPTLAQNL